MANIDWNALQAKITERTWKDAAFKKEFFADPKAAIEKYSEQKLPADTMVHVHSLTNKDIHFVIPEKPPSQSGELSDSDLEKVAGGEFFITAAVITAIATTVAAGASIANDQTQRRHRW